ncbi:MAG: hypothetical protein RL211_2033 [Pseudomonadota bacterium]
MHGLPAIRDELQLFSGAAHEDGSPTWVIQDPVLNRFYRIGWIEFELLTRWAGNNAQDVVRQINAQTTLEVTEDDVRHLLGFLADNQLLRLDLTSQVQAVAARHQRLERSALEWLAHNYLFFRLPLMRPQRWLEVLRPFLLKMRLPVVEVMILTLLGIYLVSRQWDVFTHTFVDNLTLSGMVGYGLALVLAKTVHEMGHALVATRYGVRVAHMGVAFLVMFPMLYTDTGESWRLKDPRQRLAIASAGMAIELALAGLATLLWCLVPDGAVRNGLFFLATTSWIMTLAINASPFMRFDGYFVLSDLLDFPNLHQRSSALALAWIRRTVLGFDEAWPETFSPLKRRGLIAFAVFTWIYRAGVFLGVAALVYFFFFKVLGIVLMALEVYWFILKPVINEIKLWFVRRAEVRRSRRWGLAALCLMVGVALVVPFQSQVTGDGVLRARTQQSMHSPFAARIAQMPQTRQFQAGDTIFVLDSEALGIAQTRSRQLAQAREAQLAGLLGLADGESQRQTLVAQKALYEAEEKLNRDEQDRLVLRAPFAGELVDLPGNLAPGVWVKSHESLGLMIRREEWVVDALVAESDLGHVALGQRARMRYAADPAGWMEGHVEAIDVSQTTRLPDDMLDAHLGGPVATVPAGRMGASRVARDALFRVRIRLDHPASRQHMTLVRVVIDGRSHSALARAGNRLASVFIRESGF